MDSYPRLSGRVNLRRCIGWRRRRLVASPSGLERSRSRLGGRLRELRTERELTLEGAAELARVHAVSLSHIETGSTNVTVDTLVALARAYDVEMSELVVADWEETV